VGWGKGGQETGENRGLTATKTLPSLFIVRGRKVLGGGRGGRQDERETTFLIGGFAYEKMNAKHQ